MEENSKAILNTLITKSALKQDISEDALEVFNLFRSEVVAEIATIKPEIKDERVRLNMVGKGDYEFHVYVGSDILVFQLHTNVFRLPDEHALWNSAYLKENEDHGFFGMINIYNFLAESFIQNRLDDAGYLIGRMFVNHDMHFIVEGKGQLGFLFRDLEKGIISNSIVRHIIQVSFSYALDFDLFIPPYEIMHELSVGQVQAIGNSLHTSTGKRLGFKFKAEQGEFF